MMKRIRRIRQRYKAYALDGYKRFEVVRYGSGGYYIFRELSIDEYGRGDGYIFYIARDFGRKLKHIAIALGDRSLEYCEENLEKVSEQ